MIPWEISINNPTDNVKPDSSAAAEDRWTIKRLLDWTTEYFQEHGSDHSRLDAEVLLAEALACPRIDLYTRFHEEPPSEVKTAFRDWVARHAQGEPVAYLVGHKEFFSLKFTVNPHVLIPRPETEHLVTEALDAIKEMGPAAATHVADVGTGSGCVAVSICKHAASATVTATDISEQALAVARSNAVTLGVQDRIRFLTSDLLSAVSEPAQFSLIVSNPPYIGLDEKKDLDRSVVDFEPHQALFSTGPEGNRDHSASDSTKCSTIDKRRLADV